VSQNELILPHSFISQFTLVEIGNIARKSVSMVHTICTELWFL